MTNTRTASAPVKVARIYKPDAHFEIVERATPKPGMTQVGITVQACGTCHSDVLTKESLWPGIQYPRVPGHEVVGIIDELGELVSEWKTGQRVGVGWHGGQDGTCLPCSQQYMVAPVEALALCRIIRLPVEVNPSVQMLWEGHFESN